MNKICIFNGDMSRGGGTERITQILGNALVCDPNYEVYILNLANQQGISYYPLDKRIHFITLYKKTIQGKIVELILFLRRERIDVIIDVDIMLGIYTLPALVLVRRTKLVSWEMFNLRNNIGSKHTQMIRKICLKKSKYYVNQTKGDMDAFLKEMPVKCPITYIYNPCEFDRNYYGYDEHSKIIVTAGHFFYTKGYDIAIEVARNVFVRHPDWTWEFYGDGKELGKCRQKVTEYELENNIVFCGRTSNITEVYKKAAMYVMTSRTEGFGLVLTEAKTCNLPTLAFDIDFGPREIIEHGVSGYLVDAFDIDEMANRICELIENDQLRKQFSNQAKTNCEKFSQEMFISKWQEVLLSVLNGRR